MKHIIVILLLLAGFSASALKRPNVIVLITDDQGYGDIAAHGNPYIQTPEMDRLHDQSVRLTNYHVDPTCAPSRGALMSGKFAHRARVWHTVRGGNHLRKSEVTMGDIFKNSGYDTALFGKWHLGANYPYRPMDRGFDEWLGLGDGGPNTSDGYFWNDRVNDTYWHNGEREYRAGFNPDVFYGAAMDYIKNRNDEKPFFIYLSTYMAHKPYTYPDPQFHKKYLDMGLDKEVASYYASLERVDWNIGRLRRLLDDQGLAENTLVLFMSDNGGTHTDIFNAGMAGHKGSTSDGGHRVPCFIYWPAGQLGAPRDIDTLTAHIDILPTFIDLCGLRLPRPVDFDGKSLVPLFHNQTPDWINRTLVVEKQRNAEQTPQNSAIMTQRWRLVGHKKLFDMQADPGQKNNVASEHPEVVEKLMGDFKQYWARVTPDDRSFPTPIVGTPYDDEIALSISELRDGSGYSHGYMAEGHEATGVWHIEAAKTGTYVFDVRRWPKEAEAPFDGKPEVKKTVDAWSSRGPKPTFLTKGNITALPIGSVSLKVGTFQETRNIKPGQTKMLFEVPLPKGKTTVDSVFYDKEGKRITNAYFVYVRKRDGK